MVVLIDTDSQYVSTVIEFLKSWEKQYRLALVIKMLRFWGLHPQTLEIPFYAKPELHFFCYMPLCMSALELH